MSLWGNSLTVFMEATCQEEWVKPALVYITERESSQTRNQAKNEV